MSKWPTCSGMSYVGLSWERRCAVRVLREGDRCRVHSIAREARDKLASREAGVRACMAMEQGLDRLVREIAAGEAEPQA